MNNDSAVTVKSSSIFIAYMGCLGWGSAYFYGWGGSYYYGFPWWYVGVGPDNIARSLFHAISLMMIFLIAWIIGMLLFFGIKRKKQVNDLGFFRLFLAMALLFTPMVIEFSLMSQSVLWQLIVVLLFVAFFIALIIRCYSGGVLVIWLSEIKWIKKHTMVLMMSLFIIYFWTFSFFVGFYKPQFQKNYEMIKHNDGWYYVLARHHDSLILSINFTGRHGRFIIYKTEPGKSYEINIVNVRL